MAVVHCVRLLLAEFDSPFTSHNQIPKLQQHNCAMRAIILPPSSHRFSAQEWPIHCGSEGLDSIEHLELIIRVNKSEKRE